jgi:hypothetical protein
MEPWNLLLVLFSLGVAWLAVLALPKWLLTSMNRGCMWELRDEVFDGWRRGHMSTASLNYLLAEIDTAIVAVQHLDVRANDETLFRRGNQPDSPIPA